MNTPRLNRPLALTASSFLLACTLFLANFQVRAANITWTNAAGNLLWSDGLNWDSNTVPGTGDTVLFTDTAGVTNAAGAINNIVTANTTVVAVRYVGCISNASQAHFHTTLINPGVTLTVDSPAPSGSTEIVSSYPGTAPLTDLTYNTILGTGGATLAVGNLASPSFNAGGVGPEIWVTDTTSTADAKAVLDMSQLDNFIFAGSYAVIGCDGTANNQNGALMLARTNFIKTLQPYSGASYAGFCVAAQRNTGGRAFDTGDVQLGQTNTIWTDLFAVGCARRGQGNLEFQSSLLGSSPSLFMRGTTGANPVSKIGIGDNSDFTANISNDDTGTGVVDFTGGTVDILVNTMNVGRSCGASSASTRRGSGNGTLTFTVGTIDATTLNIGTQVNNNGGSGTGVVNVRTNALLRVGGVSIGTDQGSFAGTGNGTLTISYGAQAFVTNAITEGGTGTGTSAINVVTNGTLHIGGSVSVDNLTLDGAKLHFLPGNLADISGTALLTLAGGGATIDTDNNTITLASPIGNSGSGGLFKAGSGKLILSADNPYSGGTVISNGTVRVSNTSGSATGSGAVTVTSTGTLEGAGSIAGDVTVKGTVSPGTSPGTITLGSATIDGATLNMELGASTTPGSGINDLIFVTGGLTLTNLTTVVVSPSAGLSTSGPYSLMQYGSLVSGYISNLTIVCSSPRYGFTLLDPGSTAPYVQVNVSSTLAGVPLWHGGAVGNPSVWNDFISTNWLIAGNPDKYANGDPVAFDDTALTNKVTLAGALTPASISMSNNSAAYVFTGSGSLAASGALTLYGSGSLTLSNSASDNFTGGVDLEAGSLTLATPVGPSSLGTVTLNGSSTMTVANNAANTFTAINLNSGTLTFNQPTNVTVGANLAGAGTLDKEGPNTLTLSGDNSAAWTGPIQVGAGVLRVGSSSSIYGSGVSVAAGATLDVNGISSYLNTPVTVQGSGVGGRGAIDNGSATYQTYALANITLGGDTTLGATVGGWETAPSPFWAGSYPGYFTGNGHKLTKVGTNDIWLDASSDTGLGDIEIKEGVLAFGGGPSGDCRMGDSTKTCTVRSNAVLATYAPTYTGDKQIVLDDGAFLMAGGVGAILNGPTGTVTLHGTNHIVWYVSANSANYRWNCNAPIGGPGVLQVGVPIDYPIWGPARGTFSLGASNYFVNPVIVTAGALRLEDDFALGANGTVVVNTIPLNGNTPAPRLELAGGRVIPPGVTLHLNSDGTGGTNDFRTRLVVPNGDVNEWQGTIVPHGNGNIIMVANLAASRLNLSGPITNTAFTLPAGIAFQGAGGGTISGQVNINGELEMNPGAAGVWTFSSTGNHWGFISIESGTTALGANDALSSTDPVQMPVSNGTLDLAGFNQTLCSLTNSGAAGVRVGNSSTTSDSVLTINGEGKVSVINSVISDTLPAGGSMTVALTVSNSTVHLNGANTYTGPTRVQNRGILGGTGSLASAVTVEDGGTLSPGASIGTLTIANSLTLSGLSTNVFEVDAGTLAHDEVVGLSSVNYGGTLVVNNLSATPLADGMSFKLFDSSGGYGGSFSTILPASPGTGLFWDTSTLSADGTLRVIAAPHFTAITQIGSQNFQFTIAGPLGTNYSVRFSTNVVLPMNLWQVLTSGTITTSPFTVSDIAATNAQRFYRISVP